MAEVVSEFKPLPPQWRFLQSQAKILGYGGAMGGGKSRCLCEKALDLSLLHEGIEVVVARQSHVSIIDSTKKIFMEQVVPHELVAHTLQSGGQDFVRLVNGSTVHFIGLDDPGKQFSREIGFAIVDEAHQVAEESVLLLRTRLRQRCKDCARAHERECEHYPHGLAMGFNPENPGHWLFRWFIEGATPTRWGYTKAEVYSKDGTRSMGSGEFVLAKATENVYLPENYIDDTLGGLPERLRRRYLDGEWLYTSGKLFFDSDALADLQQEVELPPLVCTSDGDPLNPKEKVRLIPRRTGDAPWWVWEPPVRERRDEETGRLHDPHRYVVAVDVSSGTANDYSAIQVLDVEDFAQVAEFQARLDMDELALEAMRAAVVYNGAVVVVETTGGWGFSVAKKLRDDYLPKYRGGEGSKPKLYTRKIWDRLSRRYTDKVGWDTNVATRAMMLDQLEEVVRKHELRLRSPRCVTEMASFVWPEAKVAGGGDYSGVPRAQAGMNDDLVLALAIGVAVTLERPKTLRRTTHKPQPLITTKTGY